MNSNATAISPHNSISSGNNINWSFGYLKVTGTVVMTAGTNNELTVTAYDDYNAVVAGYTGSHNLTFSGLANAPNGNVPTVEGVNFGSAVATTFTAGVSNANALTLVPHKVESASVDVTDGTIDSTGNASYDLDLMVNPAPLPQFLLSPQKFMQTVRMLDFNRFVHAAWSSYMPMLYLMASDIPNPQTIIKLNYN